MSKLFKDALDDAKKLREIAEQNATNKIIEAVAPRIKQLIENELMDDDDYSGDEVPEDIAMYDEEPVGDDLPEMAADDLVSADAAVLPSEEAPLEVPLAIDGVGDIAIEPEPTEFSFEKDGKQVKVSVTVESGK